MSQDSKVRIKTMVDSNDGFKIAEVDMKLRGPGDIEGTQQSGIPIDFKIANLARDSQVLNFARNVAQDIIDNDPKLENTENTVLKKQLELKWKYEFDWSKIS
jgi:ATP-dependent DNA helicase RecG